MKLSLTFSLILAALSLSAVGAAPQQAARLNNLGVAYMNQQLFEKALKAFDEAARLDPKLEVAQLNRGVALLNLQRPDDARPLLDEAVKVNSSDPNAWYNLGLLHKNNSETEAAAAAFTRVTQLDPGDSDTWYFLGTVHAQAHQYPQAIEAFQHALKVNPLHASAEFGLSRSYQQSGDAEHAREHLKKFQYITQNKLGSPISLAYGEQGKYSRVEESPAVVEKAPAGITVKFVDVTAGAGLGAKLGAAEVNPGNASLLGPGACFLDYDNDGLIDLLLTGNAGAGGLTLYHNAGNGKFEDVTRKAGLDPTLHPVSCAVGDYDSDGFADIALSLNNRVLLLHNEKNGTFKDVTQAAGIKAAGPNVALTFIDYDHDGDLDLYVTQAQFEARDLARSPDSTDDAFADDLQKPKPAGNWANQLWRNNGNGTFTDVSQETGLASKGYYTAVAGTDYNNDRAVDMVLAGWRSGVTILENPREGAFLARHPFPPATDVNGVAVLDYNHDGWMDFAFTHPDGRGISLWRSEDAVEFTPVPHPRLNWVRGWGIAAVDYDNDGYVDLVAVGETPDGRGEVRLWRNLGLGGWKDVTAETGLDKIALQEPRAIIAGDFDNDGAVDLLITQNHGPAVLLHNEGGNKNNSLRLALKGLNDNKSAIGTKVEVFSGTLKQKFEVYGATGYLGQNSPYLTIGLGQAKEADVVRMLWPTGVLQDEVEIAANKTQPFLEIDRRGSSCPTLFAWDGERYALVGDMLGAGVVGHWVGPNQRNIARPVEYIKLDRHTLREKDGKLSFRFMEPLEESVYLDQVQLLAVDHPAGVEVYPNEYFASNPPYPVFRVVFEGGAQPPAGAWDEHGHNLLPDLLAHRYVGDFKVLPFAGFTEPHTLELDLGQSYSGGPLWLLLHGEIEYFSATSMYAADQAHLQPFAPYVEALNAQGEWVRVVDDLGFPAGGPRTMTADLTGKLPVGTQRIRFTTNLQIYWDNILISRTSQQQSSRLTPVPLAQAQLGFHGFPLKIENWPPGNVAYIYEKASATGPYTRPAGAYTRYGDVRPLLSATDDKFAVFGSGDEVALDFDPAKLPAVPQGWVRDYFFAAHGYEKDMDFYAYRGDTVEPLPFGGMGSYPYVGKSFPGDAEHFNYLLEYNTRFLSGNDAGGYSFRYPDKP